MKTLSTRELQRIELHETFGVTFHDPHTCNCVHCTKCDAPFKICLYDILCTVNDSASEQPCGNEAPLDIYGQPDISRFDKIPAIKTLREMYPKLGLRTAKGLVEMAYDFRQRITGYMTDVAWDGKGNYLTHDEP
jgi:hypothetical protein